MKFEINKDYEMRLISASNNKVKYTVIKRTKCFVVLVDNESNEEVRKKVHMQDGVETCKPLGDYANSPTLRAKNKVQEVQEVQVGDKVIANKMPEDSFYQKVIGIVTKVSPHFIDIKATEVMSKWDKDFKKHPTSCATSAKIENVEKVYEGNSKKEAQENKAKYTVGTYIPGCGKITEVFPSNNPIQYEINREIFAEVVIDEAFNELENCTNENVESDFVSAPIKRDWKLLKKSAIAGDKETIKELLYKYQVESKKGGGGIGAGPGKVKHPRRGVEQLANWARFFYLKY